MAVISLSIAQAMTGILVSHAQVHEEIKISLQLPTDHDKWVTAFRPRQVITACLPDSRSLKVSRKQKSSICCDLSADSSYSSALIFSSTLCALTDAAVTSIAASTTLDVTPQDLFSTCSSD